MITTMMKTHSEKNVNADQRAMLQKAFGQPRSVREYERMPKSKIANTGFDPSGSFEEFILKDVIRPCSRDSIYPRLNTDSNFRDRNERWALETIKTCSNIDQVPKLQQFKQYNFIDRSRKEMDKYREVFLKTDHIGIKVPKPQQSKTEDDKKTSFLQMKGKYGAFSETQAGWAPYKPMFTTHNTSSMKYNIITFDPTPNYYGTSTKMLDKNLYFKQKGAAEYADLTRTYRTNFNKDFQSTLNANKNSFHTFNGIFSNIYDVCHRNGNLSVPFQCGGMKKTSKHKEEALNTNTASVKP